MAPPQRPPWARFLWLAPLVAGTTWLTTLTVMLVYWIARGRPRLPAQSNPYIPFISDIGAFALQPFFIAGCSITALSFMLTVYAVHYARYSPYLYKIQEDVIWRRWASGGALLFGLVASGGLILLAVFDTYEYSDTHTGVLLTCFAGLALCMIHTTAVWWDMTWWEVEMGTGVRKWCLMSNTLMVLEMCLTVCFITFIWTDHKYWAGIFEWVMTYTGALYLLTFMGYLRGAEMIVEEEEQAPLLNDGSRQPPTYRSNE